MAPLFGTFNVTLVILETICYLDMYLMLHVAYYGCKNQLIYHPYMTAKHYLQVNSRFLVLNSTGSEVAILVSPIKCIIARRKTWE